MTTTDPAAPAPTTATSRAIAWARRNLFKNATDTIVTLVFAPVLLFALWRAARYVFITGRWTIVRENLKLFVVGSYPADDVWYVAMGLIVFATLAGLIAGTVHARAAASAEDQRTPTLAQRVRDLVGRLWAGLVAVILMLALTKTVTPWLVALAALAAGVLARIIGARLGPRALVPALVTTVVVSGVMVWVLTIPVGWDEWGGLMLTMFLAVVSIGLCFPIGVVAALGRRSKLPIIRAISTGYIEVFRGVPLYVLLLMANVALGFFLPPSWPLPSTVVRAMVVFTLFTSAYVAEIVRGGLQSLPRGQTEAGQALGMSPPRVTFFIVLPQALRNVIPALVGQFISLFKDTVLAGAAMGLLDILSVAEAITQQGQFRGQQLIAETLAFVALVFWAGSYTMSNESQRLEKKLGVGER
jgi:general L-amino acid transport system permease protein